MEKKNGQKSCDFANIYRMKKPEDIPYSLPLNMGKEWYIEFYTVACHILKDADKDRYEVCLTKLKELVHETE